MHDFLEEYVLLLSGVSPKTEQNVHGTRVWRLGREYGLGLESKDQAVRRRGDNLSDAKPHAQLSEWQDWGLS